MAPMTRLNYLNIGPHGTFAASGHHRSSPQDVDDLVAHLATLPRKRIAIHFHGGLVDEEAGMGVAEKMMAVFEAAGSHPYGIVWETGFGETLRDNLRSVAGTELFKRLVKLVLKLASKHLAPGVGGRGPGAGLGDAEIDAGLAQERPFESWDQPAPPAAGAKGASLLDEDTLAAEAEEELDSVLGLRKAVEADLATTPELERAAVVGGAPGAGAKGILSWITLARHAAKIIVRVVRRMFSGHGHGFYPTVVEEILREILVADFGVMVWGEMKRKAHGMFAPDAGDGARAGTYLVAKLAALQAASPDLVVDVLGHSAGSIAFARMLPCAEAAGLRIRRVGLLAPAVRTDLFAAEVIPRDGTGFQALRVFTMGDDFESQDRLAWILYTRSLLYFISGVLEEDDGDTTLVGLDRDLTGVAPYTAVDAAAVSAYLHAAGRRRFVRSRSSVHDPAALPGFRTEAVHHGDFDDDVPTRESITELLSANVVP